MAYICYFNLENRRDQGTEEAKYKTFRCYQTEAWPNI